ncbi:DNA primase [candidate division CPR3 bacterium GWF2_35_18]|uniref:DNA primase n=1 Tax=candidate division CPR3 bacterium GW2011_GWF2_35_18 TaxID=1618350 RepID=A0A0G0C0B6_UNCC3|nr:MAG: primase protein [candidate division CPR3 bacterium GW2011_GWF2_35_18]KKR24140.1 MAG: primase, DNA primase protein [Candidatus Peregrinibacteria bacterium GW2011_GWE2_39_6]OGB62995.1 MAG: DNA primase [candidate division CPR3 bacterium GWF2_35_18]OGB63981.1 MAG: DNA primase [candidate division CPR3 bacterium RIFOXYA2_FULL_35_13]OGB78433.1 MAG: DNA primase [candidate division CPR3 bacterium RIFOXYB2_FULL_35_8]
MDQLEEIKSKLDIVTIIGERITLKKAGRNFKARCPFHSEETPSFMVSPERQIFKCFGCGEGGDIFGFIMKYEHLEFGEALKFLAEKAGVKLKQEYKKQATSDKDLYYKINFLAAEFFHYLLAKDKIGQKARDYLKERNIKETSVKEFNLGYAADSWDLLGRFLQKKGYTLPQIEKCGLIVQKTSGRGYYDRFRQRLMFPIFDLQGNMVGFSGRILNSKIKDAPKYLNTPETPIYNKGRLLFGLFQAKESLRQKNEIILTEGNIDIISSHQAGFPNIVAPLGTALTPDQARLIKRYVENVLLSFDIDIAGDKASRRGIEILENEGLNIKVLEFEKGKDLDEALQINKDALNNAVSKAISIYDFYLKSALNRYSAADPFAKKKIAQELLPLFAKIINPIIRAHYLQKLATTLEIEEETIFKEADKYQNRIITPKFSMQVLSKSSEKDLLERLSEYLLTLNLQKEDLTLVDVKSIDIKYLEGEKVILLWTKLVDYLKNNKQFLISEFYATLEPEEVKFADEFFLLDLSYLTEIEKEREEEDCIKKIKELFLRRKQKSLQEEIVKAEEGGLESQLKKMSEEFRDISQKLHELDQSRDPRHFII